MIVNASAAPLYGILPVAVVHCSTPGVLFSHSDTKTALPCLDVYLSIGSMMQLSKANLRGLSTSSRKSQLAQKVTGEKLMTAVQSMMARPSQQADAVD